MIRVRASAERGFVDHGWLQSFHTFSFAAYDDARYRGFRALRVLNDDRVAPGAGFPTHPHRDMEILTYVVQGTLEHRDSLGNGYVIRAGDVQRMTAGTGVTHSEFNPSDHEPLRLLQIWILPGRQGLPPGYEQRHFPEAERRGRLRPIASRDGREGSLTLHQDVVAYAGLLAAGQQVDHPLAPGRHAWLHVVRGAVTRGRLRLSEGAGAAVSGEPGLAVEAATQCELLLFDLA
jgi:hypothetical protein